MRLGQKIKELRNKAEVSMIDMAVFLNIPRQKYKTWEEYGDADVLSNKQAQQLIDLFMLHYFDKSENDRIEGMDIAIDHIRNSYSLKIVAYEHSVLYPGFLITVQELLDAYSNKNDINNSQTSNNTQRYFIDMDGVLAVWNTGASIEEVASPGYFRNLMPMENCVRAVRDLIQNGKAIYILSSVFEDSHSINEKNKWLDQYLPEIPHANRLFVPYSMKKHEFLEKEMENLKKDDVLLDDYTKNLQEWHGIGIKMLNGINNTNGTWRGYVVKSDMHHEKLAKQIEAIAEIA